MTSEGHLVADPSSDSADFSPPRRRTQAEPLFESGAIPLRVRVAPSRREWRRGVAVTQRRRRSVETAKDDAEEKDGVNVVDVDQQVKIFLIFFLLHYKNKLVCFSLVSLSSKI